MKTTADAVADIHAAREHHISSLATRFAAGLIRSMGDRNLLAADVSDIYSLRTVTDVRMGQHNPTRKLLELINRAGGRIVWGDPEDGLDIISTGDGWAITIQVDGEPRSVRLTHEELGRALAGESIAR